MKYKSSWWLLLLFVGLAGFSWYMFRNKPDKISLLIADRDFAVKDVSKIQKIFLATRNREPITLEKINGVWMLNGKYKAALNPIKNLLETIKNIRMQSIPPKGQVKGIMEGIAVYGIKVEIYGSENEKLKTFYVGGATQAEYGTYYYMEHGSQPYTMEIPHFAGNVRQRFDLDLIDWRDKTLFDFPSSDMEKISVEYPYQLEHSFIIKKEGNQYGLYDFAKQNLRLKTSRPDILKKYIEDFEGIGAEDLQNESPMRKETINLKPYCSISINLTGKTDPMVYKFFPIQIDTSDKVHYEINPALIDKGEVFKWHVDRSDGDFLLMQYPNLQAVLKKKQDFQ